MRNSLKNWWFCGSINMEYLFNILPAGFEVENLAETYVIFITENDVIGKNQTIYHIERYCRPYNITAGFKRRKSGINKGF